MPQTLTPSATQLDGVSRCSRYAFGPNRLHLCGPDANQEVLAYIGEGAVDLGLTHILRGFATLYPYLDQIARSNNIRDPFDARVVEAYWLGNTLLETIPARTFFQHLRDTLDLKRKYGAKQFDQLAQKIPQGRMHHSFHVMNAYKRTGHDAKLHTLESMDSCRVSWGKVTEVVGPKVTALRRPLELNGHQLQLGQEAISHVTRRLDNDFALDDLAPGDLVTMHWNVICETVTPEQVKHLWAYTEQAIRLSNTTN